jgi:transcriptional regulator with XRE-family HTH domain
MLSIKEIGKQIKERRNNLRVTQADLAELAGVSPNTLYKIERGQANPSVRILFKILDVLGLQIDLKVKDINL